MQFTMIYATPHLLSYYKTQHLNISAEHEQVKWFELWSRVSVVNQAVIMCCYCIDTDQGYLWWEDGK